MKSACSIVGLVLLVLAALATPVSVVYGIYEWAVIDLEFKVALWEMAKMWISMIAMLVPGGILFFLGNL